MPRPQLTVDELAQLRWLLGGALILLGVGTAAYMDVEVWWMMLPTALAAVVTTFWPMLPARVPRLVSVLAFPAIAAFFAGDLWLRSEILPAMVRLDMLLLLYRALVYRQRRDDLQVIVLGLFLVVVAGVLTVSLWFAVQILAYTACSLVFLLVLTLSESARTASAAVAALPEAGGAGRTAAADARPAGAAVASVGAPSWAVHANWPRLARRVWAVIDPRVVVLSTALFLGLIAASALLFLAIPRFELDNGMFLDRFITKKARTGFSDTIRFGDVTEIQRDTSVALDVSVAEPGLIPLAPYWRMLVLDDYQNGTFRMSPALRGSAFEHERTGMTVYGGAGARGRSMWTLYLAAGVSRYLPLLGPFRQLRFAEAQTFQSAHALGLVTLTKDPVTMTAYQVEGFDFASPPRDIPTGAESDRAPRAGAGRAAEPMDEVALRRLAHEAAGDGVLPAGEFATRVCAWLRGRHAYSLSPQIPNGAGDPLVRWAGSDRPGHCELFAGSFVLIARAAGYPARVVTGFRGGSWNAFSNSFTVRNSDAHAWAEIFDRQSGAWLRADPLELPTATTDAAATGAAGVAHRTDRSWSARLDSLRVFWYRRVVSFDQQSQLHTLKAAKEGVQLAFGSLRERVRRGAAMLTGWWHQPWSGGRLLRVGVLLFAAIALTWLWHRVQVRCAAWIHRRRGGDEDPVRREAGRWLQRLTRVPAAKPPAELVGELQRLRFGARVTWPDPQPVFRRARRAESAGRRR